MAKDVSFGSLLGLLLRMIATAMNIIKGIHEWVSIFANVASQLRE